MPRRERAFLLLATLTLVTAGCLGNSKPPAAPDQRTAAPDFAFQDINGATHKLTEFSGKTVVIDLMSSGCSSCTPESIALQKAAQPYTGDKLVVLIFDVVPSDPASLLKDYAHKYGTATTFIAYAPQDLIQNYRVNVLDWNAVIDTQGRVAWTDTDLTSESTWTSVLKDVVPA